MAIIGEKSSWGEAVGERKRGGCRGADGWRVKSQSAAEVQREGGERRGERHLAAEGRERREKRERTRKQDTVGESECEWERGGEAVGSGCLTPGRSKDAGRCDFSFFFFNIIFSKGEKGKSLFFFYLNFINWSFFSFSNSGSLPCFFPCLSVVY